MWPVLGGGIGTVATGRMSPFPPSGNEGYIRNRDVPFQSGSAHMEVPGMVPYNRGRHIWQGQQSGLCRGKDTGSP